MRRRLALGLGLAGACLAPAPALGAVTVTEFSVVPSETQGGGHPNVTITQAVEYDSASDSVNDGFVRLQPGLLGNPQNAAFCSRDHTTTLKKSVRVRGKAPRRRR